MSGTVYLVGAGPGAADLLTVRAARLLGEAEWFPRRAHRRRSPALASKAQKIAVGKRCGRHATAQRFINKRLADAARPRWQVPCASRAVTRCFARAHEEIAYLQARRIPVEVVPGVTAALAASADLRISLTRRGAARTVAFVTPRVAAGERESGWVACVLAADTAAVYMGAGEAPAIAAALIAAGKPAHAARARGGCFAPGDARSVRHVARLPRLPSSGGPTLILLGEVYREALAGGPIVRCRTG